MLRRSLESAPSRWGQLELTYSGRLAVPTRPVVVRAAPTLPGVSRVGLPSASPACCDRPGMESSHLHPEMQRLVAHEAPDPGGRPLSTDPADAAHDPAARHPRLRAQRHRGPVRSTPDRNWEGDHRPAQVPHRRGLHRVLETRSTARSPPTSTCTSSSTTSPPTRPQRCTSGSCGTDASTSTSPRPTDHG